MADNSNASLKDAATRRRHYRRDPITDAAPIQTQDPRPVVRRDVRCDVPRARGQVTLAVAAEGTGDGVGEAVGPTRLKRLRQAGSLKCLFPRADPPGIDAVLVNTAGGITGGDRFEIAAQVGAGARLTLTTQAAERAYAAQPGETGRLTTWLDVAAGARLDWIPQETILFDRAALARRLTLTLAPGATALVAEPMIFGRTATGEVLRAGAFSDRIEIRRDGRLLYLDALRLEGNIAAGLDRPHGANGARALVSLVYVGADAEALVAPARALLPETGGASLIGADVLALRILAEGGFELRRSLVPLLAFLTRRPGGDLPKPWMI